MGPMTRLERILLQVVLTALVMAAACFASFQWGWDARQAKLDKETLQAVADAQEREREALRIASKLEQGLRSTEKKYDRAVRQRREADQLPVTCPASGAVGDVVLPAGFIDSMFNRPADVEPAASEPNARVQ